MNDPVLGISFDDHFIRAVALQPVASRMPEVLAAVAAPMPPDVLSDGVIIRPESVGTAIHDMLAGAGIKARYALVGLPSHAVFSRVINIPSVPERERRAVVRGEIDYLNILPTGQGGFDFTLLTRKANLYGPGPGVVGSIKGDPVLSFAANTRILDSYFAAVSGAGLSVIGMEPADYAAIRTAYPRVATRPIALAISVGTTFTHLQFFEEGRSIFARRLDVGADHLVGREADRAGTVALYRNHSGEMQFPPGQPGPPDSDVNAQLLAMEIGRSLDYFSREFITDLSGLCAMVLPNDSALAELPAFLSTALEQEFEMPAVFQWVVPSSQVTAQVPPEQRVTFAPALGLALAAAGGSFTNLPAFDLSANAMAEKIYRQLQERFRKGALAAGVIFAMSLGAAALLEMQYAPVVRDLAAKRQLLQQLEQKTQIVVTDLDSQKKLIDQIHSKNVPWTNILSYLSQAVPPGIGLTSLGAQGSTITITGETLDLNQVPLFWNTMNNSRLFTSANVTSVSRYKDKTTFQMTAVLPQGEPTENASEGLGKQE